MIDTVRVSLKGKYRRKHLPLDWLPRKRSHIVEPEEGESYEVGTAIVQHHPTGLRLIGDSKYCSAVEVSLPRLIFPTNGHLIKTAEELNRARARIIEIASEICDLDPTQENRVYRLDLVLNLPISPVTLFRVYRHFTPKRLHVDPIVYPGSGLFWKGSMLKCRLYDKHLHITRKPGNVARLEWELLPRFMQMNCPEHLDFQKLDLEKCYATYRSLSLGFKPKKILSKSLIPDLLALAEREDFRPNGISFWDHFANSRHPKRVKQMMRQVIGRHLAFEDIDLEKLLPPQFKDAPKVEVTARRGVKTVRPW